MNAASGAAMPKLRPSYFALCSEEPFRIFFPLGVLFGISGVSLWPLFFAGIHKFYPGIMHARLMIEGFMGGFVFGFLGTAGPRLTGTPRLSGRELGALLSLHIAAVAAHIAERPIIGDAIFLALLALFVALMGRRFARCEELPPPSFVLVALGFLNAMAGGAGLVAGAFGAGNPRLYTIGGSLLNQAFILFLVLGVGSFLLPRILNIAPPSLAELGMSPMTWRKRATFALAIGLAINTTFFADLFGASLSTMSLVRFALAAIYLVRALPFYQTFTPSQTMMRCAQLGLVLLALGLLFPALWPLQRMAGLHVVFIGGFTLVTLTVATRVILGHSGGAHLFRKPLPFLVAVLIALLGALVLRVLGDFVLDSRGALLSAASYLWIVAGAIWSWRILPRVRIPDPESQT